MSSRWTTRRKVKALIKYINLRFFKGGSSTQTVEKRDPKSDQLKAMDDAFYNIMGGLTQRYGGVAMPTIASYSPNSATNTANQYTTDAQKTSSGKLTVPVSSGDVTTANKSVAAGNGYNNTGWNNGGYLDTAFDQADYLTGLANQNTANLLNTVPGYLNKASNITEQAANLASNYNDLYIKSDYDKNFNSIYNNLANAEKLSGINLDDSNWYIQQHKGLLNDGTNTGLQNALSNMNKSIYSGLQKSAQNGLDDWASRGIVNGTTMNRALDNLTGNAADAAAANYSSIYNSMLSNYLGGAEQSRNNAAAARTNAQDLNNDYFKLNDSMYSANTNALNSNNSKVNNLLSAAGNYNTLYNSGLNGLKTFADLPSTYYSNALAPLSSAYNFWKDSTNAWLANDKDTVVTSNSK